MQLTFNQMLIPRVREISSTNSLVITCAVIKWRESICSKRLAFHTHHIHCNACFPRRHGLACFSEWLPSFSVFHKVLANFLLLQIFFSLFFLINYLESQAFDIYHARNSLPFYLHKPAMEIFYSLNSPLWYSITV